MISIEAPGAVRTMMISFRRGDYIIEELQKLLKKEGVDAALITSGIGSLDICKLHTITGTDLPPKDRYFDLEGPVEVGALHGSVLQRYLVVVYGCIYNKPRVFLLPIAKSWNTLQVIYLKNH